MNFDTQGASYISYTTGLVIAICLLVIFWALNKLERDRTQKREAKLIDDMVGEETLMAVRKFDEAVQKSHSKHRDRD